MSDVNYKAAYERQKKARALAEELLENRSRELYEANQSLQYAYNKLKNQKAQILHQEKLASIGQLSAGVAHEINNPTGYVKSNLNTLKGYSQDLVRFYSAVNTLFANYCTSLPDGTCSAESKELIAQLGVLKEAHDIDFLLADIADIVDESHDGIKRIENIVKGLKDFSRPDESEPQTVNLISCLENTIKLVSNQVKHKLNITFEHEGQLFIKGQQGSLSQVFLNLIVNASHAVADNGHLNIKAKAAEGFAMLHFIDDGCGMDTPTQIKVFEPFFTTKEQGVGTGLGLSISHGIIKKHGGLISVNSELGQGTEFIIQLPLDA